MTGGQLRFDEIGYWSEVKLEILRKYAQAYSQILSNQPGFTHYYIDGFAGAGVHISRSTGDWIPGSPLNALNVRPPFGHYFLIDLDGNRVEELRRRMGERTDVTLLAGDCNVLLLDRIFPRVRYEDYARALCLLDPYGLQLNWEVILAAGRSRTIDLFLNFPIMDMNRNALWGTPDRVPAQNVSRMTAFWGDDSWKDAAYEPSRQADLFDREAVDKRSNEEIVDAFRHRLRSVAGFEHVPMPMPMRNKHNAVVYYLFFASHKDTANRIATDIFRQYADRAGA